MQLYRGMDIGTAKLPVAERRGIPHHLLDVLDVTDEAAVAWYQDAARAAIDEILARGADAILVGGSGLYVSSVLFDFRFPPRDEALRARARGRARARTAPACCSTGSATPIPATAERVDPRNGRRIVRALEVLAQGERDARRGAARRARAVARRRRIIGVDRPARRARRAPRRARRAHVGRRAARRGRARSAQRGLERRRHRAPRDRLRAGARAAARRRDARPRRSPRRRRSRAATRVGRCRGSSDIPTCAWVDRRARCRDRLADTGLDDHASAPSPCATPSPSSPSGRPPASRGPWNNPHLDIQRKLTVQPELFLVAVDARRHRRHGDGRLRRAPRMAVLPRHPTRAARAGHRPRPRRRRRGRAARDGLPEGAAHGAPGQRRRARLLRRARLRAVRHSATGKRLIAD